MAQERAAALKDQFIMDMHTHFLRDDTRLTNFVRSREAVGKAGWNPALVDKPQTLEDLKFNNYFKEVYLDSDTKIALISPRLRKSRATGYYQRDDDRGARQGEQGGRRRRMFAHAIFTPGWPGWLEPSKARSSQAGIDQGLHGRRQHQQGPRQASLAHGRREGHLQGLRAVREAGIKNVCVHKGLFPQATAERFPHLLAYADVRDVGKAAKDWPQLNFVIYHGGYRHAAGGRAEDGWPSSSRPGASPGSATSPRFRKSTASPTSMPTSANCSRRA